MISSSAGAKERAPPHTIQAPVFSTTLYTSSLFKATGITLSIISVVPAGEVIALVDVLGTTSPLAANIGTSIGVIPFPAVPPMECLSTTKSLLFFINLKSKISPDSAIPLVIQYISSSVKPGLKKVDTKNATSVSLSLLEPISSIIATNSSSLSLCPDSFFLIPSNALLVEGISKSTFLPIGI